MLLLFSSFLYDFFILQATIKGHYTAQIGHPRDPISGLEVLGHSYSCTTTPKISSSRSVYTTLSSL